MRQAPPLFKPVLFGGPDSQNSVKLYGELEAETGQHVGFSKVSNFAWRAPRTWDEFMYYAGIAETIGVKVNKLTPQQLKELWPLCEIDGIFGASSIPMTAISSRQI